MEVSDRILLGNGWVSFMGGFPSWLPTDAAFSLLSRPHPPDPLPRRGRGRFSVFLCKGLRPLHPRGWVRCGTGVACGKRVTAGGLLSRLPAAPAFSFLSCPHPPDPLPGGKGETKVISGKGLRPLHPRGLGGMRHWGCLWKAGCGGGACPGGTGARWALMRPAGGLLFWLPANPAFSLIFCPHPPNPLPGGKGETKVISGKGLRPLHPRGWVGCGTGFACGKRGTAGGLAFFAACRLRLAGTQRGLAFLVACRPCPEPSLSFIPISRQEDRAQTIGLSQYSIFGKSSGGSGGLFQESPSVLPVVSPAPSANAVRRERVRERPSRCMTV